MAILSRLKPVRDVARKATRRGSMELTGQGGQDATVLAGRDRVGAGRRAHCPRHDDMERDVCGVDERGGRGTNHCAVSWSDVPYGKIWELRFMLSIPTV
ncbi:hypothetical protein ABZP36_014775 [Zizania latifolia]